jgi:2-polyprenyl-6-methoxyphenol hydroxylase-like FAD-dependent oxidoreductase
VAGSRFDVAIVGASIAGCTAARFFALAGARVALIDRDPDPDAYKVVCTHAIQSSATPAIERLGLAPLLEARGAVRTSARFWTPFSDWIVLPDGLPLGWGITRRSLDPMLRKLAAGTPGVELVLGHTVTELIGDNGQPAGVRTTDRDGRVRAFDARLVVAADGRGSTIARLAGVPGRVRRHGRFFYFAYWEGLRPATTDVHAWMTDPEGVARFPNEDGLDLLVASVHRSRLPDYRADAEGEYARQIAGLPDAPDLSDATRVSRLIGKLDMPNVMRPAARPGLAFVGDAALASDPLWGVGCGWALQMSEWLVDETADALLNLGDLDAALERYRRALRRRLGLHHWVIAEYASGRKTFAVERAFFRATAKDPVLARALADVASRRKQPTRLADPRMTARVLLGQLD